VDQPQDSMATVTPSLPDEIADFSRNVIARHSEQWPVSEQVLADEFLAFFGPASFLHFEGMVEFCHLRLQIPVSLAPMPKELRGFNGSYGNKREIFVASEPRIPDTKLHTLLHELREVIERQFQELGSPVASDEDLEVRAEAFASSVQISAVINLVPKIMNGASEIEKKWMRVGAYVGICAVAVLYCFVLASIPHLEDAFADERSQR